MHINIYNPTFKKANFENQTFNLDNLFYVNLALELRKENLALKFWGHRII